MHTVTSFHSASVAPEQLNAVMADYVALDQARLYRRLFVTRFAGLAFIFGTIGFGFHWMPPFASWLSVALCAVAPVWAWIAELRCDWRLNKRLNALPDRTDVVAPPGRVRKT